MGRGFVTHANIATTGADAKAGGVECLHSGRSGYVPHAVQALLLVRAAASAPAADAGACVSSKAAPGGNVVLADLIRPVPADGQLHPQEEPVTYVGSAGTPNVAVVVTAPASTPDAAVVFGWVRILWVPRKTA